MRKRRKRKYRNFEQSQPAAWSWRPPAPGMEANGDIAEWEETTPAGLPSWTRHLAMASSVALGLGVAVLVVVLAIQLRRGLAFQVAGGDALFWAAVTFGVALALGLALAVVDFRLSLAAVESWVGKDLGGDGHVGQPDKLDLTVHLPDEQKFLFAELDVSLEDFRTFCAGVLAGRGLGVSTWSGAGGLWTRPQFEGLRDVLVSRGILRWKDAAKRNLGVELSPAGRAVLRQFVEDGDVAYGW